MGDQPIVRCDLDAEAAVLCSMLSDEDSALEAIELLTGQDFFANSNQQIFATGREILAGGGRLDAVAVASALRASGRLDQVGGTAYLAQLANATPAVSHVAQHAKTVRDLARLRRAAATFQLLAAEAKSMAIDDIDGWLEECESRAYAATSNRGDGKPTASDYTELARMAYEEVAQARERGKKMLGRTTGFQLLDEHLGGLEAGDLIVVAGRPGHGKCLGRGTRVLLFSGDTVAVEQVRAGDLLMGPDSKPRRVLSTAHGIGPLYRIQPTKGDPWVCNWCHVLTLVRSSTGKVIDIALDEYQQKSAKFKHEYKLFGVGVEFAKQTEELPIDPYVLGLWIGDGDKGLRSFRVTKPDNEVEASLSEFATACGMRTTVNLPHNRCKTVSVVGPRGQKSPLLATMRGLFADGLCIPDRYKLGSRDERLELLAGLLDSDGHLAYGSFEFVQKNKRVADDTAFLARSLGFRVVQTPKAVNGTEYQRLMIMGDCSVVPNRIARKKADPRRQKKDVLRTGFTVEPLGDDEYFGFELDGDGRFLLGDFTVTHNTALAMQVGENVAKDQSDPAAAIMLSQEMLRVRLMLRSLARVASESLRALRTGQPSSWGNLSNAVAKLSGLPIVVDDEKRLTPLKVRSKVRRHYNTIRARNPGLPLGVVVIDYVQLMQADNFVKGETRALELGRITRELKIMAGELGCAVLLLSQLRRADKSKGKNGMSPRPTLEDLRDSGSIEADADVVLAIHREDEHRAPDEKPDGRAEILVLKGRNSGRGHHDLYFDGARTAFSEHEPQQDLGFNGHHHQGDEDERYGN